MSRVKAVLGIPWAIADGVIDTIALPIRRRLDPEGSRAATQIAAALEALSWAQVAGLTSNEGFHEATVAVGGVERAVEIGLTWDGPAWAADVSGYVLVQGARRGEPTRWKHLRGFTKPGAGFPAAPPAPARLDLAAFVASALA